MYQVVRGYGHGGHPDVDAAENKKRRMFLKLLKFYKCSSPDEIKNALRIGINNMQGHPLDPLDRRGFEEIVILFTELEQETERLLNTLIKSGHIILV
jgi:hypothetical protein